ncbi:Uncharacterised protein [Escherichia coli]|nr:Uncharacterised protein [Escherichia coli]
MKFRFAHHTHGFFPGKNRKMPPTVQVQKDVQAVSSLSVPVEEPLASFYIVTSRYWINTEGSRSPLTIALTIERPVTPVISRYGMMQLNIHLHQRLLHMLDMRSPVFSQTFPLSQIRSEYGNVVFRSETDPEKAK